jgi:hypothetical protein
MRDVKRPCYIRLATYPLIELLNALAATGGTVCSAPPPLLPAPPWLWRRVQYAWLTPACVV